MDDDTPSIGAIPILPGVDVDGLLETVVAVLRAEGLRLAGFLQGRADAGGMHVLDLAGGGLYCISQRLGSGSQGCKLDPRGLAEAATVALAALETGPDLLVIPRFGKAEVEGEGMRAVIARACEMAVPVLAAVREDSRPAWETFTGGLAVDLPPERQAVLGWCRSVLFQRA